MSRDRPPWFLLWHTAGHSGAIAIGVVLLAVVAMRYWPPVAERIEGWWRSARRD